MSIYRGDCGVGGGGGSVEADIAGEEKPFQGQHGTTTFGPYMTARSRVWASLEPKMGQQRAGDGMRSRAKVMFPKDLKE